MFLELRAAKSGSIIAPGEPVLSQLGLSGGTLGRFLGICLRLNFEVDFGSIFSSLLGRFAAEARPLELKLRELCMHFAPRLARPATSAEVRRI